MKRSWFSILAIVGVISLLTLFIGLQYKWLSAASEAERDRMQKRVETDTARFAEDFNREMQAAYFNFQTDAETWRTSNWSEFNARYDYWKSRTAYPELVRNIYFFAREGEPGTLQYVPAERTFTALQPTAEITALRTRLSDDKNFSPVFDDEFAMALPIYGHEKRIDHMVVLRRDGPGEPQMKIPDKFGWLVVLLDENVIKTRVLPDLAAKYFPEKDYSISIIDRGQHFVFNTANSIDTPDATASLFNLSPDNLMFFANRELLPKTGERRDVVINQRVESQTFTARTQSSDSKGETFKVEMHGPVGASKPRTAMIAGTGLGGEPWTLRAQHASGSIDAFVKGERNKSFLIGLGVYLLLVAGIAAILLSAMRSKRFAQRQIDFVSSVSHEFRTPLAVIYSAGENLADGVAKEQSQVSRYGELIKGEGKKLSGMVEQILEFAGANSGRRNFNFSATDVSKIIDDALTECQPLIESNGFTIETDVPEDLSQISADKAALSSAIQNLIVNSVKYSNGSKWIKLSASNGGGSVKISVEDKGIGIADDDMRLIFEPFYRAKNVVDEQISGNGLGLNLVKKIVEAHGGKVSAVSKPGSGSTFTLELPQK